jgi:hypothetical protein
MAGYGIPVFCEGSTGRDEIRVFVMALALLSLGPYYYAGAELTTSTLNSPKS